MQNRNGKRCSIKGNYRSKLIFAHDVTIKDISSSGICVKTSKYLTSNNHYRIQIASGNNESISPACIVVRSFLNGTKKIDNKIVPVYEVALKFVELTDKEKNFIENSCI
jgi:hypothetical protein